MILGYVESSILAICIHCLLCELLLSMSDSMMLASLFT